MEQLKPAEFSLEVLVHPSCIKDVVAGILHVIFFHRYFPAVRPSTFEVLEFTLPSIADQDLEIQIETMVGRLARQLSSTESPQGSIRGALIVTFHEKKRRKAGWFGGVKADDDVVWERWNIEVTLATPRTENERMRGIQAVESSLQKTITRIISIVNREKHHIPPITTSESNPFPYNIDIKPRVAGWNKGTSIY